MTSRDDLLRFRVERVQQLPDGFRTRIATIHRGEENWRWDRDRSEFDTHYDDVVLLIYGPEGDEIVRRSVGDLDPGDTAFVEATTARFPMTITAMPGDVSSDQDCSHDDTGAQLTVYAGEFVAPRPFGEFEPGDGNEPQRLVHDRIDRWGTGHRWIPAGEFPSHQEPPPSADRLANGRCSQRQLVGRDRDGPPDLSMVPGDLPWLERRETNRVTLYAREGQAPRLDMRTTAASVPDAIARRYRETDWTDMDGVASVSYTVSYGEWIRLIGILEGTGEPRLPPCDEHAMCRRPLYTVGPGRCHRGGVQAAYQFAPDRVLDAQRAAESSERGLRGPSLAYMEHRWEGVPAPE